MQLTEILNLSQILLYVIRGIVSDLSVQGEWLVRIQDLMSPGNREYFMTILFITKYALDIRILDFSCKMWIIVVFRIHYNFISFQLYSTEMTFMSTEKNAFQAQTMRRKGKTKQSTVWKTIENKSHQRHHSTQCLL